VLPLTDRNPTYHKAFVTITLIVLNVIIFAFVQQRSGEESITLPDGRQATIASEVRFTLEHAAIPCELIQGRSLDLAEIQAVARGDTEVCNEFDGPQLFPDKNVWLAGLVSMFMHASWLHLGFNMLFLWIFGNNIEDHVGPVKYVVFYLLAGLAALGAHVFLQTESAIPLVGASGAVAGVMGAYLIWFPRAPIKTIVFIVLVDIKAIWWLSGWFVLQFFTGQDSGIAWAAHVGGFVFGAVAAALVRQIRPLCRWVWREPWRQNAFYRWDLSGGSSSGGPPRFGGRSW